MTKLTLTNLTNLQNESTAVGAINANNDALETAIENTLSRDGTSPNEMNADLDMNSHRIYNLAQAVSGTEPVRKAEYDEELGSILANAERAEAAADEAEALLEAFQGSWFGGLASDPTTDLNGAALSAGDAYYNTTNGVIRYYNGSAWVDFPVQNGLINRQTFTATAGQTTFTVSGGYTAPYLFVYYNGVLLFPSEYTATNGTTVVLASGALENAEISIVKFEAFSVANALIAANNLSDVADINTARTNLGLGSLATKNTVATADIDDDVVTFTKIQNITDNRLLGRSSGSDGDMQHITVGSGLSLSGGTLVTTAAAPVSQDSGFELASSVAGNALTIALKTVSGSDASGSDPVNIAVSSGTGVVTTVSITAAKSITISSGSTLGTSNNVPFRVWVVLLSNGNMAVINCRSSANIFPLRSSFPAASVTAEGGAGAADSSQTFYSSSGTTNVYYTILGYVEYSSGLATAGTWNSSPSLTVVYRPGMPLPGECVQQVVSHGGSGSTTTSTSYVDVTSATLSITPTSAASIIHVNFESALISGAGGAGVNATASQQVCRGTTAISSIRSVGATSGGGANLNVFGSSVITVYDIPGTTSNQSYKLQHLASVGTSTTTTNNVNIFLREIMV